jgi:preprotein translocase subunit SecE
MSDDTFPSKNNNHYTPLTNIMCRYRFNCGAEICPKYIDNIEIRPKCKVEKYNRYQPDIDSGEWYEKSWEEVNNITWYDIVTLKESWMYLLILIIIAVFIFFCATLIYLYNSSI